MSHVMSNPFTNLGAPPEGDDPEGQLRYLRQVMDAFSQTDNPRVKPLGRKLDVALEKMAKKSERGADPETLARELHAEVRALSLQTYELLLTVLQLLKPYHFECPSAKPMFEPSLCRASPLFVTASLGAQPHPVQPLAWATLRRNGRLPDDQ